MSARDLLESLVGRLGDAVFHLRDRIDRLSPPSWREAAASAGTSAARVDWRRLRTLRGLREMLGERPGVVAGACGVAMLAAASIVGVSGLGHRPRVPKTWFYDAGSKRLFAAAGTLTPPIEPPSGATLADGTPGGVRAYVYGCGACDEKSRFVAYLERVSPEALKAMQNGAAEVPAASEWPQGEGMLVASPEKPDDWLAWKSDAAQAMMDASIARCPEGAAAAPCLPE